MKRSLLAVGAVFAVGAATLVAVPATAAPACTSPAVTLEALDAGCSVKTGTVKLPDGRTFVIPAPGVSVVSTSTGITGTPRVEDVTVSNTASSGVVVQVGHDRWHGPKTGVAEEKTKLKRRERAAKAAPAPAAPEFSTMASCGSSA